MGCSSSNASRENEVDFPQDYEELAKQISELKIRKDMGIIIAIDVKVPDISTCLSHRFNKQF